MTLYDNLVYCYLIGKQYYVNCYNSILIYCLGFKELMTFSDNKINKNITWRFLLYLFITKIINVITRLRDKINIQVDKIHITKITYEGEKTIILDKRMREIDDNAVTFNNLSEHFNTIKPDNIMMKQIFINYDLINGEKKVSLKDYTIKYKDINSQYHNTIQNILLFNNIDYDNNSTINIKFIKNRKMITKDILLKEIQDKHINSILLYL